MYVQDKPAIIMLNSILVQLIPGGLSGVVQTGFTTYEFVHTWNTPDTCLLEVQILVAYEICRQLDPDRFVSATVNSMFLIIHNAFSPNDDLINDSWNIGNSELTEKWRSRFTTGGVAWLEV